MGGACFAHLAVVVLATRPRRKCVVFRGGGRRGVFEVGGHTAGIVLDRKSVVGALVKAVRNLSTSMYSKLVHVHN